MISTQLPLYKYILKLLFWTFLAYPFARYFYFPYWAHAFVCIIAGLAILPALDKKDVLIAIGLNVVFLFTVITLSYKGAETELLLFPFYMLAAFATFIICKNIDHRQSLYICVGLLSLYVVYFGFVYYKYFPFHHIHDNLLMGGQASSNVIPTLMIPLLALSMALTTLDETPRKAKILFYILFAIIAPLLILQGSKLGLISLLYFFIAFSFKNVKVIYLLLLLFFALIIPAVLIAEVRIFEFFEVSLTNEFRVKYWLCVYRGNLDFMDILIGPDYPENVCGEGTSYYSSLITSHAVAGIVGLISIISLSLALLSLSRSYFLFFTSLGFLFRFTLESDYFFTGADIFIGAIFGVLYKNLLKVPPVYEKDLV